MSTWVTFNLNIEIIYTSLYIIRRKLFKLYDLDRNGFVDIYEYLLGVNIDQQKKFEDKLSNLFKIYDKNNIGLLDKSDYEKISKHVISLHNCKTFYNSYNKNVESKQVKELVNVLGKLWATNLSNWNFFYYKLKVNIGRK